MRQEPAATSTESLALKHQDPNAPNPAWFMTQMEREWQQPFELGGSSCSKQCFPLLFKKAPAWSQTTSKKFLCEVDG